MRINWDNIVQRNPYTSKTKLATTPTGRLYTSIVKVLIPELSRIADFFR